MYGRRQLVIRKKFPMEEIEGIQDENSIESRIAKILLKVGIPKDTNGFAYLLQAIKKGYESTAFEHGILKEIHSEIAEVYGLKSGSIRQAIERVIKIAYANEENKAMCFVATTGCKIKMAEGEFIRNIVRTMKEQDENENM